MKKYLLLVLFWGSLWGIAEATLGYVVHMAAIALPGLPGFLMFPLAFYFMKKAYNSTEKVSAIFLVAVVAALIKLTDFLLPVYIPIRIINPALSILLEGLAVFAVYQVRIARQLSIGYIQTLIMGVTWRSIFLLHLFIISLYGLPAALVTDGIQVSLRFVILESFINSLLIYGYLYWGKMGSRMAIKPVYAYSAFAVAIAIQRFL